MKLMNSDTHSLTVSLASFAIFAFAGSAFFIILLIFAIGKNRSCSRTAAHLNRPHQFRPRLHCMQAFETRGGTPFLRCAETLRRKKSPRFLLCVAYLAVTGPFYTFLYLPFVFSFSGVFCNSLFYFIF